jgi:hypothetical protein
MGTSGATEVKKWHVKMKDVSIKAVAAARMLAEMISR